MTDSPFSVESLRKSWERMRRHPRTSAVRELAIGVDGTKAEAFEARLLQNLSEISRKIHHRDEDGLPTYRFGPLLKFQHKKTGSTPRDIYVARIRDQLVLRIVHEIVCAAAQRQLGTSLKPPRTVEMIDDFRRNAIGFNCPFVLRTDIQSFFESVPRKRVVEQATSLVDDPITKGLLLRWSSQIIGRPAWHSGQRSDFELSGLPTGISLSSSLAELYLVNLDKQARQLFRWFRYTDDILVLCESEAAAHAAREWITDTIYSLDLSISAHKTKIGTLQDGVPWLGLIHFTSETRAEPARVTRWLTRFVSMKRNAAVQVRSCSDSESRQAAVAEFHRKLRREVRGLGNSRPHWYSRVEDDGLWKRLDGSLHSMIRSVHRAASLSPPTGRLLPSVHSLIAVRRERLSAPQNADQGQCANSPDTQGLTPTKGK